MADDDAVRRAALQLVVMVRSAGGVRIRRHEEIMAAAALYRCVDLLHAMTEREERDPLVPMGLRDIIETALNGLVCLEVPDQLDRFLRADRDNRRRIVQRLNVDDVTLTEVMAQYADLDESRGVMPFGQRVEELFKSRPDLFGGRADADLVQGSYAYISNHLMHGGIAAIDNYLSRHDPSVAATLIEQPDFWPDTTECLSLGSVFTTRLLDQLRSREVIAV